jgi:hypothetical protein
MRTVGAPRVAHVCRQLLAAIDASEGRRRRRKRDTTPDAIGLALKRRLLEDAIRADPDPGGFEAWLFERAGREAAGGPVRAMARSVLEEWRLAQQSDAFRAWLKEGAPSQDRPGSR